MAPVQIGDLLNRVETILQDDTNVRWTVGELLGWANDAYREIVLSRPDINTATGTMTCVAGTRQASLGIKSQSDQAVTPQEGAPRPPTTTRDM